MFSDRTFSFEPCFFTVYGFGLFHFLFGGWECCVLFAVHCEENIICKNEWMEFIKDLLGELIMCCCCSLIWVKSMNGDLWGDCIGEIYMARLCCRGAYYGLLRRFWVWLGMIICCSMFCINWGDYVGNNMVVVREYRSMYPIWEDLALVRHGTILF